MIRYLTSAAEVRAEQLSGGFFEGWPGAPSAPAHLALLRSSAHVVLAVDDRTAAVVGFVTAVSDGVLSAYIPLLEVLPAYRGRGIGSALVERLLETIGPLYMIDLVCDADLEPFYARFGLRPMTAMVLRDRAAVARDPTPPAAGWEIAGPAPGVPATCEGILRALPEWFGIEEALVQYVEDATRMPTFTAADDGTAIGFLSIREHFPETAEIHVMGVRPEHHRRGVGRALVGAAQRWLRGRGCRFLQVKTVSASRDDPSYARTRRFYLGVGFAPVEEFPTLWSEANPCLLLIKPVS